MSKPPRSRPDPQNKIVVTSRPHAPTSDEAPSASSQFKATTGTDSLIILKKRAMRHLQQRRARKRFFNEQLFTDVAWDILLSLFIADADASDPSIAALSEAAGASETTTERWVAALKAEGLLELARTASHREANVALTARGHSAMVGALGSDLE